MRGALIIHILFLMSYRHTIPRIDNKTRIMNKDYPTDDFLLVGFKQECGSTVSVASAMLVFLAEANLPGSGGWW